MRKAKMDNIIENENTIENEEIPETENEEIPETNSDEEVELNDEGVPRPKPDPKNGLYTFLSLLIFAVGYAGVNYAKNNFFIPYTKTLTEFSERNASILNSEINYEKANDYDIAYAKILSGTGNDYLTVRYEIGDKESFGELIADDFFCETDINGENISERIQVYENETMDTDYIYGEVYASSVYPDLTLRVFEKDKKCYAEFIKSEYDKSVKSAFGECDKIKINLENNVSDTE